MTPSFVPNTDVCGFGGESYLNEDYYQTGTAYDQPVFSNGTIAVTINNQSAQQVLDKVSLGEGKSSAVGIHVGTAGAKAFVQQSTGTVVSQEVTPAIDVKSGLRSWQEK